MQKSIEITDGITRHPLYRMQEPVNISFHADEQIAIVGPNAGGKSRLVDIITGRYPLLMNEVKYDFTPSPFKLASENIKYITFRDSYGDNDSTYYYQQRWNQHDIDEKNTPTVGSILEQAFENANKNIGYGLGEDEKAKAKEERTKLREKLYELFHIDSLLDKYIILLSSGELRKFQITKTLLSGPRILIMDNPFIGLDKQTREQLSNLINSLINETGLQIILVLSKTDDIPDFITHVLPVENLTVGKKTSLHDYLQQKGENSIARNITGNTTGNITGMNAGKAAAKEKKDFDKEFAMLPEKVNAAAPTDNEGAILKFNDVSIRYGNRTILDRINWTVRQGEKWALSGENGSGKSTLLSLVCADNPQSYACNIELFGKKRGSGESIWDIKKHIGYVSPEMHRAYLKDMPAIDIVASGLNDSIGLYVTPKAEDRKTCEFWMKIFGVYDIKDCTFLKLSSGEQRLCLLARAFVKDPELLILDEPLHGLDDKNREMVRKIISSFCKRKDKTLIMVTHYQEELPDCITNSIYLKKNN